MGIDREKIFFPYLSNYDVEEMYIILKGSRKGISSFMKKAKSVATGNIYKFIALSVLVVCLYSSFSSFVKSK